MMYGELNSEKHAEENDICRKIVKELVEFGVNQRQILFIVYLLSLQLEDNDQMMKIAALAKELGSEKLFVKTEEVHDGATD